MKNLAVYNKAFVSVAMAALYFLNENYGISIPLDETSVIILFGLISSFITWAVPNKKV